MALFKISWRSSTRKDFRKIPSNDVARIIAAVEGLAADQHPTGSVKLSGVERTYRIRVGDFRVIYIVDPPTETVDIVRVRHRREVYRP